MQTILNWLLVKEKEPTIRDHLFILEKSELLEDNALIFHTGYLSEYGKWMSTSDCDRDGWETEIDNPIFWCEEPEFENERLCIKCYIKCPECNGTGYYKGYNPSPDDDAPICVFCEHKGKIEIDLSEVICE